MDMNIKEALMRLLKKIDGEEMGEGMEGQEEMAGKEMLLMGEEKEESPDMAPDLDKQKIMEALMGSGSLGRDPMSLREKAMMKHKKT